MPPSLRLTIRGCASTAPTSRHVCSLRMGGQLPEPASPPRWAKNRPEAEIEIAKVEGEAWVSIGSMIERPLEVVQRVEIQAAAQ